MDAAVQRLRRTAEAADCSNDLQWMPDGRDAGFNIPSGVRLRPED